MEALNLLRSHSKQWDNTCKEFEKQGLGEPDPKRILIDANQAISLAIEFAQYHVKEALLAASKKAVVTFDPFDDDESCPYVDTDEILTSYNLNLIK